MVSTIQTVAVGGAHDEVRRVVGQVAVGLDVVDLEADGEVVLGERLHVRRVFEETRRTPARSRRRCGSPTILLNTDFFGGEVRRGLGAEGPRVAQADAVLDARAAAVLDRQRVDGGLEGVEQHLADFRLGEVAQHHRVFEIDRRRLRRGDSRMKVFTLRIEHVVAADEAQVLQQLAGEEGDDGAVVGRAGAVELDGVMHLAVEHGLEDDLARFLRRERLERQAWRCRSAPGRVRRGP